MTEIDISDPRVLDLTNRIGFVLDDGGDEESAVVALGVYFGLAVERGECDLRTWMQFLYDVAAYAIAMHRDGVLVELPTGVSRAAH